MTEQLRRLFTALMFLTRLPCPSWSDHDPDRLARSTGYFPVVGLVVGAIGAAAYALLWTLGFPCTVAAILAVAATVTVTGAFHEDAFADVCDGFGGYTPERRREIMRDSRVGSFGVAGLSLLLLCRVAVLSAMPPHRALLALIAAHTLGRWSSLVMIARYPYAADAASLAKPFAGSVTAGRFAFATLVTAATLWPLGPTAAGAAATLCLLLCLAAGRFFGRWLGGITGDCLGAINQLTELLCYLAALRLH